MSAFLSIGGTSTPARSGFRTRCTWSFTGKGWTRESRRFDEIRKGGLSADGRRAHTSQLLLAQPVQTFAPGAKKHQCDMKALRRCAELELSLGPVRTRLRVGNSGSGLNAKIRTVRCVRRSTNSAVRTAERFSTGQISTRD